jgi:excisionase family DNA binding protein
MKEAGDLERLMTKGELADRWRVSEKTIDRHIRNNGLPHIRIGRQIRFRLSDILAHEKKMRK